MKEETFDLDSMKIKKSQKIIWHDKTEEAPIEKRIIVFSPEYGDDFKIRIIDSQFLKITSDVKYWTVIEYPEN